MAYDVYPLRRESARGKKLIENVNVACMPFGNALFAGLIPY